MCPVGGVPGKSKKSCVSVRRGRNNGGWSISTLQYYIVPVCRVRGGGRMSIYDEKPWLKSYVPGQPAEIVSEHADGLSMFRSAVARNPDADAIRYFGTRIS